MRDKSDTMEKKKIVKFYDRFFDEQGDTGVNLRHYSIFKEAVDTGLKRGHSVLEVGCGVGQLTSLLAKYLRSGSIVSTDISPKSLARAKETLSDYDHIRFVESDMTDFTSDVKFDFVILPDVLEHIPLEQHGHLFRMISETLTDDGSVVIHIPHPNHLEVVREKKPELLQVIDQSLFSDLIIPKIYDAGLWLSQLKSYNLFHEGYPDYQFLILKKNAHDGALVSKSNWKISRDKMMKRFFFGLRTLF